MWHYRDYGRAILTASVRRELRRPLLGVWVKPNDRTCLRVNQSAAARSESTETGGGKAWKANQIVNEIVLSFLNETVDQPLQPLLLDRAGVTETDTRAV